MDSGPLAPTQHPPTAETTVGSQRDLHFWPAFAQHSDQQRQDRPGVFSRIDVAFAQIADQKPFPTKDIQRQKTEVVRPVAQKPQNNVVGLVTYLVSYPSHDGGAGSAGTAVELSGQFG